MTGVAQLTLLLSGDKNEGPMFLLPLFYGCWKNDQKKPPKKTSVRGKAAVTHISNL